MLISIHLPMIESTDSLGVGDPHVVAAAAAWQRSPCNAVRHGLTAETVIGALEDAEDYKAFEAAVGREMDATTIETPTLTWSTQTGFVSSNRVVAHLGRKSRSGFAKALTCQRNRRHDGNALIG